MTARLGTHADVSGRAGDVLDRLVRAGVDVEPHGGRGSGWSPLAALGEGTIDLALVGIAALRGSAAEDFTTVAVLPREEPRDVLVALGGAPTGLSGLSRGARVGVHGARRSAFLRAHRPDAVQVELADPDATGLGGRDDLEAAVVGAVEARRARLVERVVEVLDVRSWLPEPGKGALALVARHPIAEATALDHLPTRTALRAELALLDALGLDPGAPLGSLAQPSGRWIRLWAAAASADGNRLVRSDLTGPLDEPEALGSAVARQLVERGVGLVLAGSS